MAPGLYNMMNMGGYGMGSFGIGNGYNFFTNCDGTMNTNAMLGYGLANVGLNSIFNCCWGGGAGSSSNKTNKESIGNYNEQINKLLDKIGTGVTTANMDDWKADTYPDSALKTANQNRNDAQTKFDELGSTEITFTKDGAAPKNLSDCTDTDYNNMTPHNKKKYDDYQKLKEDLAPTGKYQKAIDSAKENRQREIDQIKDQIKALIEKRDALQRVKDAQVLDDADGHGWQQTSLDDFNKKYANTNLANLKKGTKITINNDDKGHPQKVTKGDLRGLIARYRGTRDPELKKLYANQFKQLWELADPSIQNDSTLGNAYNIMHDDMVEIGTDPAAAAV